MCEAGHTTSPVRVWRRQVEALGTATVSCAWRCAPRLGGDTRLPRMLAWQDLRDRDGARRAQDDVADLECLSAFRLECSGHCITSSFEPCWPRLLEAFDPCRHHLSLGGGHCRLACAIPHIQRGYGANRESFTTTPLHQADNATVA